MSCHILCAHSDPAVALRLKEAIRELTGEVLQVSDFRDAHSLLSTALELRQAEDEVAMVFCGLDIAGTEGGDLFRTLTKEPLLRGVRRILLDTAANAAAVDNLLQQGLVKARLDPDFEMFHLQHLLSSQLTDFVTYSAPHLIDELHSLLDLRLMADALKTTRKNFELLSKRMSEMQQSVVGEAPMSDATVEESMIQEFDRVLDQPERHHYKAGEVMVHEGDEAGRIWIVLSGRVKLIRTIEGEEVIFHSESAGRLLGLMSLSLQNPVFFTCRAVTDVTAIVLTREQVREAIQKSTKLSHDLIIVIMRTMARRNARSADLLTEVRALNIQLSRQRDELASTLRTLRATQHQLIDSAKMATLGNLAAGMAHELNNPVGAIMRSTEHLEEDLMCLLAGSTEPGTAADIIPMARELTPLSTREERQLRKELAAEMQIDAADAALLIAAGIRSRSQFDQYARKSGTGETRESRSRLIKEISRAGQIGAALRNLSNCSKRISELVRSLKVYAHDEQDLTPGVDVHQTLEDALLILANKVKTIELEKEYGPLPLICANASQLQQVWTNLIANAIQALDGPGAIRIRTSVPRDQWIRVDIEDNGPGIPDEIRDMLWEARFTTRAGRVEFGLGLGLSIVQTIVRHHGGTINFESKPGQTVFTIELPVSAERS